MNECVLCEGLKNNREIFNRPLYETDNFVIFPDRLPMADFHILIVSKKHYINIWDILNVGLELELEKIIQHVNNRLISHGYKNIVLFEHGKAHKSETNGGKSVEHFHVHIVAEVPLLMQTLKKSHSEIIVYNSFDEMKKAQGVLIDYLYVRDLSSSVMSVFTMENGIASQYIRLLLYSQMSKTLAEKLQITGEYGFDWKTHDKVITPNIVDFYKKIII